MVDNIGPAEDMVVRKSANIHNPADFKGKKVATPFGSTSHFRLLGFLAVNKLTQADVTVLDMTPNVMVAAWHRGDIDAGYVWAPAKSKLLEEGGVSYPTYKELDAAGYVIADLIVATKAFSQQYPDAVVGFLKAYGRALAMWKDKPDDAAQIVAKQAGVTADVAKSDMEEYDFVTQQDQLSPAWLGTPRTARPVHRGAEAHRRLPGAAEEHPLGTGAGGVPEGHEHRVPAACCRGLRLHAANRRPVPTRPLVSFADVTVEYGAGVAAVRALERVI